MFYEKWLWNDTKWGRPFKMNQRCIVPGCILSPLLRRQSRDVIYRALSEKGFDKRCINSRYIAGQIQYMLCTEHTRQVFVTSEIINMIAQSKNFVQQPPWCLEANAGLESWPWRKCCSSKGHTFHLPHLTNIPHCCITVLRVKQNIPRHTNEPSTPSSSRKFSACFLFSRSFSKKPWSKTHARLLAQCYQWYSRLHVFLP